MEKIGVRFETGTKAGVLVIFIGSCNETPLNLSEEGIHTR